MCPTAAALADPFQRGLRAFQQASVRPSVLVYSNGNSHIHAPSLSPVVQALLLINVCSQSVELVVEVRNNDVAILLNPASVHRVWM